ncbi:hypothetical protein JVU11DRAFT_7461 [Chiua virens]|nr:hypothetical protein JVU11DRAFT_7461 [Chiua virens]
MKGLLIQECMTSQRGTRRFHVQLKGRLHSCLTSLGRPVRTIPHMSGTATIKGRDARGLPCPATCIMVYPGFSIASGHVCDDDRKLSRVSIVEHPSVDGPRSSAKKRRKERAEPAKKRRRGDQKGLCQLNFDELYIIFAYIYPMDLLNLARTCKSLRNILMHKSSQFLWKTALRQIEDFPDCPPDLTEPEYTNLVFYNRCHGCGKSAITVLWSIRRRYCPACRVERLHLLDSHPPFLRESLPNDWFMIGDESFMLEYHRSSDKEQFLKEKQKQRHIISLHARECERWQERKGRIHRFDLDVLRKERQTSIFERLRQRGYGPEIAYFKDATIEKSYKSVFKKYKPLTDSEWDRIWPEWLKIMNNFRTRRLEAVFYQPRRRSLMSEYDRYVTHPSPDSPAFDILPHVTDLCRLPPFRDIIRAFEETQLDDKPFASAFAQLPVVVDQWIQRLSSEIAALVKIPSYLSFDHVFGDWDEATSSMIGHSELFQVDSDKLHLACAVFYSRWLGCFRLS